MPFTLDWFMQNMGGGQRQQPQQSFGGQSQQPANPYGVPQQMANQMRPQFKQYLNNAPIQNEAGSTLGYGEPGTYPRSAIQSTHLIPRPQQLQQGRGRPPRVPGPSNPLGRKRVPQVPQVQQQSARINRMNWIDWVDPTKGGGSFR